MGRVSLGLLLPLALCAQARETQSPPRSFEVASVKAASQPWMQIAPQFSGSRVTWNADLTNLIGYAYQLQSWRLSGTIPGSDHIYTIDARASEGATGEDIRQMFQTLLAERFQMTSHWVKKDVDGYAVTTAKGGLKLHEAKAGDAAAPMPEYFAGNGIPAAVLEGKVVTSLQKPGVAAVTGRRVTVAQLAEGLERLLRTSVIDETGLSGNYYFGFLYAKEGQEADTDLPSLFSALQAELGLKLEKRRAPVEVLVVDHIEKTPSEN